jgi:hypothetical protein
MAAMEETDTKRSNVDEHDYCDIDDGSEQC